jgi:flagellar protein FliS
MTQEQIRDYTLRISQANASNLTAIIYELLLDSLEEARQALDREETPSYRRFIKRAERYMEELIHGLNLGDAVARQIVKQYIALHKTMIQAEYTLDAHLISTVMQELTQLQKHFVRIAKEDNEPPIMGNTQKVYAGLTYGRNSLNETAVETSQSRGYQV